MRGVAPKSIFVQTVPFPDMGFHETLFQPYRIAETPSMTPPLPQNPRKRRLLWLAVFLLVVFAAYSAGWFYLADRVRTEAANTIAALEAKGVNADCANLAVSGYPVRFAISCDNTAYEDDAGDIAVSTGAITAVAPLYRPFSPNADITGPLRTSIPGMAPLWLDWDRMHIATGLLWPATQRVSLQAEGFSGQTDPQDETDPLQLFSADKATAEMRPEGQDVAAGISFSALQIDAGALGGRTLPPLDGALEATLRNGIALIAAQTESLRGQSLDLKQAVLSSGTAGIEISGPLAVDAGGLIDADLTIRIRDPQALATILATAVPEQQRQIQQGFAGLALMGKEPTLPLKIVKGKAALGFIPLGQIEPLE